MNCLKCGREVAEGQVFCTGCLEVMDKYPVKPGIAIQLPGKKDIPSAKKQPQKRKQPPTVEEQLHRLKKKMRRVILLWLVTLLLLAATVYPAFKFFTGDLFPLPGQNYTTITTTESNIP